MGSNVKFTTEDNKKTGTFLTDAEDMVMLEPGEGPGVSPLCELTTHHLQLHIAVESDEPDKESEYFASNGTRFIENCPVTLSGDKLIVLNDPWGNCIQLVKINKESNE